MTNNTSTERLLPCPFCAAQAKSWCAYPGDGDRAAFYIECDDCDARTCAWWTEAEAVAAWNRRPTPETERLRSALDSLDVGALAREVESQEWRTPPGEVREVASERIAAAVLFEIRRQIAQSLLTPPRDPQ